MARSYNYIYKRLVESPDDIVGQIAYGLYKADKIEFIEKFKNEHNGEEPTEDDFKSFHSVSCLERTLERYKLAAESILQQFLDYNMESFQTQFAEDCINNHKEILADVVSDLKPMGAMKQFFFGLSQSVVGAFVFALLLAAIGFINLFKVSDLNISVQKNKPQETTQEYSLPSDTVPSQN